MTRWMWACLVVLAAGCAQGVGPGGVIVGGACQLSHQCAPQAHCLTGERFPEGYCVQSCHVSSDCPGGSSCVMEAGGVCMQDCTNEASCRTGYQCAAVQSIDTDAMPQVCTNPL